MKIQSQIRNDKDGSTYAKFSYLVKDCHRMWKIDTMSIRKREEDKDKLKAVPTCPNLKNSSRFTHNHHNRGIHESH